MKLFKTCLLAASVAALASAGAVAQSYNVKILETPNSVKNLLGSKINDQGLVNLTAHAPLNAELDFDLILPSLLANSGIPLDFDPEEDTLTLQQYDRLILLLADKQNQLTEAQRIATTFGAVYNGQTVELPALLNTAGNGASSTENSSDSQFLGLNQNNIQVGIASAPYYRTEFTYTPPASDDEEPTPITKNFAQRDFTSRGIWYDGSQLKLITPTEQEVLGGESALFDINEHNVAAGYMSVSLTPQGADRVTGCQEYAEEENANTSLYNCVWLGWFNAQSSTVGSMRQNLSIYDMHATIWQLDAQGEVVSFESYEPLSPRREDDEEAMSTYAYAINNNDIAVGQSWTYLGDNVDFFFRTKMPAIFVNGETRPVTTDNQYTWGSATDINNEDIAVGFVYKTIQGYGRSLPFTFNVNTNEFELLPQFFASSSTFPAAINDNGFIVGRGEIDYSLDSIRRQAGFVYDPSAPEKGLQNLNDLVGCSATDYFIVAADDINENNEIVATAIRKVERVDVDGSTYEEDQLFSLLLTPTGDDNGLGCSNDSETIERQGAATSLLSLLAMLLIGGLITVRRKFGA